MEEKPKVRRLDGSGFILPVLQRRLFVRGQITFRLPDPHENQHDQQRGRLHGELIPEHGPITPQQAQARRLRLRDVGEGKDKRYAQEDEAVDQCPREALLPLGKTGGDEDVGYVVGYVDADGSADHGGEDVGPVIRPGRSEGEEEGVEDPSETTD